MVDATPKAAELAAELGIDLAGVEGSGRGGRITVGDVRAIRAEPLTPVSVTAALVEYLERIARSGPDGRRLARSPLAATAIAMAGEIDAPNSATAKSNCAKQLIDALGLLGEAAPAESKEDVVDQLSARVASVRRGVSGT